MSDEIDPGLKRLFAQTAEHPADEAFVAQVAAGTLRARLALRALAVVGVVLALAVLGPELGRLAGQAALAFGQLASFLAATPYGWITGLGLVFAGALSIRALASWRAG